MSTTTSTTAAIPKGWRDVIAEAHNRLSDSTPSAFDNSGYREFAGTVLDAVADGLAELEAALEQQVPGWQVVPVEPTPAMDAAAFHCCEVDGESNGFTNGTEARRAIYREMLAAAPHPLTP